jgi:hypothetical protein
VTDTDTLGGITTGSAVFATTATKSSAAGSYAIDGSGLTLTSTDYVLAQASGNGTALSITAGASPIQNVVSQYVGMTIAEILKKTAREQVIRVRIAGFGEFGLAADVAVGDISRDANSAKRTLQNYFSTDYLYKSSTAQDLVNIAKYTAKTAIEAVCPTCSFSDADYDKWLKAAW